MRMITDEGGVAKLRRGHFYAPFEHTDAGIDRLVYQLYNLIADEIALVEEATK